MPVFLIKDSLLTPVIDLPIPGPPASPDDPRVINLTTFNIGKMLFKNFFTYLDSSEINSSINVNAVVFRDTIETFITSSQIDEKDIGLRFVHAVDEGNDKYHILMQICKLKGNEYDDEREIDTSNFAWYKLTENSITPVTLAHDLIEDLTYAEKVKFDPDSLGGSTPSKIIKDDDPTSTKHIRSIIFPWNNEIKLIFDHNSFDNNTFITFSGYTLNINNLPAISKTEWPHGLVIYFSIDVHGTITPQLNDIPQAISLFNNKGANYATLCPPNCKKYIKP